MLMKLATAAHYDRLGDYAIHAGFKHKLVCQVGYLGSISSTCLREDLKIAKRQSQTISVFFRFCDLRDSKLYINILTKLNPKRVLLVPISLLMSLQS